MVIFIRQLLIFVISFYKVRSYLSPSVDRFIVAPRESQWPNSYSALHSKEVGHRAGEGAKCAVRICTYIFEWEFMARE